MDFILLILTSKSYGYSALFILITGSIYVSFLMRRKQKSIVREIKAATEALGEYEDARQFTDGYESIHEILSSNNTLSHPWHEYEETLVEPIEDIDDDSYSVYRNTKRPAEFFVPSYFQSLIEPKLRAEEFIGIGLLLTFLGLVAALVTAGTGLGDATGSAEDMKVVIVTLLATAGSKFFASIGGVGGSLIVSLVHRILAKTIADELSRFNDSLEKRLIFASAEKIAADQYKHMIRQTGNLERLSNEIAVAIGDRIENAMNRMPEMMSEAMSGVTERLTDVASNIEQTGTEGMASMVNQLSDELTGAGQETMQQVVTQLDTLSTTMGGTVDSLRTTTELLQESLTSSAQSAASELSSSSEAFSQRITDAIEAMGQGQQGLHDTVGQLIANLEAGSNNFADNMQSAQQQTQQQLVESLSAMNAHIARQASQASEQWQAELNNTISAGAATTAEKLNEAAELVGNTLQAPMAEMSSSLDNWVEQTNSVSTALREVNTQLGAHRNGIIESTGKLSEASNAMKSASESVRDTTIPMRDAAAAAKTASEQLLTISQTTAERVSNFSEHVGETVTETKQILDTLNETWAAQHGQLNAADQQLANAFTQIGSNVNQYLSTLGQFTQAIDKNLGEAVDGLAGIVDELNDSVEAMQGGRTNG